jgi:hypothetical protein
MAEHQHLPLPSAEVSLPRRKKSGFAGGEERDYHTHAANLSESVTEVIRAYQRAPPLGHVRPSMIMKVDTLGYTAETDWAAADLTILATGSDNTLVVLSSDEQLRTFTERLEAYGEGPRGDAKSPPHANFIAPIESISLLNPEDRIGDLLLEAGLTHPNDFDPMTIYSLDVELWEISPRQRRLRQIEDIVQLIEQNGGEVLDRYIGHSMTVLRVSGPGSLFSLLLNLTDTRQLDLPPTVDSSIGDLLDLGLADFPDIPSARTDGPSVTIIDSGISSEHPLLQPAIGECIAIPAHLTPDDTWGHGTKVAGIAVYGDLRAQLEAGGIAPGVLVHSARVLKDDGKFPDNLLVQTQMREAITYFREAHGCKVYNISLGDPRSIYAGKKVSNWAAALDELARDLNVVIVISAGNLRYNGATPENSLTDYPHYLLDGGSAIFEPASAALGLTVGSLSHASAVPEDEKDRVGLHPIAPVNGPSPFTRSGPIGSRCSKPDLCDYGGNLTFDGIAQTVSSKWPPNGILTLNSQYLRQLFATTIGTSLAAPLVAYKAALVFDHFPEASANLVRALLASSARVPETAKALLSPIDPEAVRRICGSGIPDITRAIYSDDHRVTMVAEGSINQDQFYVYEIPIVDEFSQTRGRRHISISLAFDPPVRHTRADYLGNRMSFRLVRGGTLAEVTDFYKKRPKADGKPDRGNTRECALEPSSTRREYNTLQKATFTMEQNPRDYGDVYYLVVRCEARWATPAVQNFAVVVTVEHENTTQLYARIAERVRVRARVAA